ncbi:TonB-dependent receptor domain-containing protein [Helicobacter muridarum]|uniref:Iron-regulated outer membrane protein FrpB2 n=6 Tax=Helicobacter muridarum TaxID=216 RepID=A0A377PR46_9HELI|nr:TonB-dependent receptor [Helicobacter muridarum]STQ85438.1 Iron-regulated outer membrane protein FrpB2 [Helicobacter muridarum]
MKKFFILNMISIAYALAVQQDKLNNDNQTHLLNAVTATSHLQGYETSTKTIITSTEIENTQALNLKEIFKSDPSIAVGGGSVMGQKVYVRGFETFMMRVTIDGAAQTGNAFHHQGNVMADPSLLKQVVVSKGVSDASSGPGGLTGSIAFQTKDASDFLRKGQNFGAEISTGFFTNFGYRAQVTAYARLFNDVGILASVNHQNILNYRDAKNVYKNFLTTRNAVLGSNSLQNNILLKIGGQLDETKRLSIGYSIINDFANRPFRADIGEATGENFGSEIFKTHNQNQNFNATYEYNPGHGKTGINVSVYNNIRNVNLVPLFDVATGGTGHDDEGKLPRAIVFNNYGGNVRLNNDFNDIHLLEYGLDFQGISVRDDNMQKSEQEGVNRGREEAYIFGGFAQDSWQILPNLKWGFGSRADLYYYYDKNSQSHFTGGVSPSTGLYYTPLDGLDISLKYAFSTRGAMPGDATLLRDSHIFISSNLKSEYSNHAEFTLDYGNDFMSARFATYVGNILNFINSYSKGTNNGTTNREGVRENLDFPIINYGFELGLAFYYERLSAQLGVARNWLTAGGIGNGKLLADTYELGATWGYTFNISLKYEMDNFDVAWFSRFVTGFKDGTQGFNIYQREFEDIGKEGYTISDVHFNYYPLGKDKLTLRFSILNIFNQFYVDPTSPLKVEADNSKSESINQVRAALYEPGTDYRIEVRYRF